MIFCIDNYKKPKEVLVYESIEQLVDMVEWQDISDKGVTNIGSDGLIYEWDDTKRGEYATIYGYSMKVVGTNVDLANNCIQTYERLNKPSEFLLENQF